MATAPKFSFPLPTGDTLTKVPLKLAMMFRVLPIRATATTLTVVASDPNNKGMLARLQKETGLKIDARKVPAHEVEEALKFAYASQALDEGPFPASGPLGGGGGRPSLSSGEFPPRQPGGRKSFGKESFPPKPKPGKPRPSGRPSLAGSPPGGARSGDSGDPWFDDFSGNANTSGEASVSEEWADPPPAAEPARAEEMVVERPGEDGDFGADEEDIRTLREDSSASAELVKLVNDLLTDAIRMGASEIFIDAQADRYPFRARIGSRIATIRDIGRNDGSDVLSRLRNMALISERSEDGCDAGRIDFRLEDKGQVDLYLRTFPRHLYECQVLDVIRYPGVKIDRQPPRGLSAGSPGKLHEQLAARLKDRRLGHKVAKLLCGPPSLIAVAASRHRSRESMLSMLAGTLAGPAMGSRVIYLGERPRFYLEKQYVVLLLTDHHGYKEVLSYAPRMSSDYLFIEHAKDYDDVLAAMHASASQHVIFGIDASDPTDALVNLTSAPETQRLAHRLGAILYLDAATMKVVEMTQPLRDAVGAARKPASMRRMVEKEAEEGSPLLGQSMELSPSDFFPDGPLGGGRKSRG